MQWSPLVFRFQDSAVLVSGSLLQLHLRMAIGSLQKTSVTVTGQLSHRLFVHTVVQHGGDEVVPEGVEMVLP